jgi:hypothetical protein
LSDTLPRNTHLALATTCSLLDARLLGLLLPADSAPLSGRRLVPDPGQIYYVIGWVGRRRCGSGHHAYQARCWQRRPRKAAAPRRAAAAAATVAGGFNAYKCAYAMNRVVWEPAALAPRGDTWTWLPRTGRCWLVASASLEWCAAEAIRAADNDFLRHAKAIAVTVTAASWSSSKHVMMTCATSQRRRLQPPCIICVWHGLCTRLP